MDKKLDGFFAFYGSKYIWFGKKSIDKYDRKVYLGTSEKKARRKFNKLIRNLQNVKEILDV